MRRASPHPTLAIALVAALTGAACVGTISDGDGAAGGGARPGAAPGDDGSGRLGDGAASADPLAAGALPLRRLTTVEYENTVRDLFADPAIAVDLPPDPVGAHGFAEAPLLSDDTANALRDSAETLATRAIARFDTLMACDAAAQGDDACARAFVTRFGRRAFRRALASDEVDGFMGLYATAKNDLKYDLKDASRLLVTAFLQSPSFLYHWELGSDPVTHEGAVAKLAPYQLASRLSYFFWSSMPDDALLDHAAAGTLATDAGLTAEVDRLVASDRFAATVTLFHDQWLDLDKDVSKDTTLFPDFGAPLRAAMNDETSRFLRYVFLEGDGKLSTLFTSTVADVDPLMASLYGLPAGGAGVRRVQLDPATRAGLFTRASLLSVDANASTTNPPRSGAKLWQKVLCKTIAAPPPGAAAAFHFDTTLSTRENFSKLESDPSCKGCHAVINPIGFAFEGYDAIGRRRAMEGSHAIDASGTLASDPAHPRPFSSIVDLSATLASDPDATSCVARQWFRFAVQRSETDADRASLEAAYARFTSSTFDVRALLKAFATSRTFRYRAIEAGESP